MAEFSRGFNLEPEPPYEGVKRETHFQRAAKYMLILFMHGEQAMQDRLFDDWSDEIANWEAQPIEG